MIASYDPNKALILKRNPYFKEFSADAMPDGYPDEIDYSFGLQDEAEVTAVLNGQYDWMFDEKPLDRLAELGSKHASLVHIHPLLAYYYMPLNVNLAPFNNLQGAAGGGLCGGPQRHRQAVGRHAARLAAVPAAAGGHARLCRRTARSPRTPARASGPRLISRRPSSWCKESGTAGQKVTVISSDKVVEKSIGEYLASVLRSIGYDAQRKAISTNIQFTYIQNTNNKVQASLTDWYQDYPAPSDFLYVLFGCDSYPPRLGQLDQHRRLVRQEGRRADEEGAGDGGHRRRRPPTRSGRRWTRRSPTRFPPSRCSSRNTSISSASGSATTPGPIRSTCCSARHG